MKTAKVAILMGSDSDLPVAQKAVDTLAGFDIPCEVRVMSAHRSPEKVWEFAVNARSNGFAVIIAIAGGAAHLAGVVSSATTLPVIGVPVATSMAGGLDSLLSTSQMPAGVPVLTVGSNSGGPANAAVAAARILALGDDHLAVRLDAYRASLAESVDSKDAAIITHFAKPRD